MMPLELIVRNLSAEWTKVNGRTFGGALLTPPTFIVVDMDRSAADWDPQRRLIRFSRSFVESRPWATVVEVLKHEMAHQYVSDVIGVDDETAHGPTFQMICERYGIDGRAGGSFRTPDEEHTIDKIKKLFALGTSPNENEAKAALAQAQRLLERHKLSEAELHGTEPDDFGVLHVGEVVMRTKPEEYQTWVSRILAQHFRVKCIWIATRDCTGRMGLQLEVCGRRADLVVAEHVHEFLLAEAARLWERTGRSGERNRLDFFEGVMAGFAATLAEEAKARAGDVGSSIVHRSDVAVQDFFDRRYPRTSNIRGSRRRRGEMYGTGQEEGKRIKMRSPLAGQGPKLLG